MPVHEIFRVYEHLYDNADTIARQNNLDIAQYAGHAAYLLNQASAAGICAGSVLVGEKREYRLPRLASSRHLPKTYRPDMLYFDVEFLENEHVEQFKSYANKQTHAAWGERMNRALILAEFVVDHLGVGHPVTMHNPQTGATVNTVL